MNENDMEFSTGAKGWMLLCMAALTLSAFNLLLQELPIMALMSIITMGFTFWLLIFKKKLAFYLIVLMNIIICVFNLIGYESIIALVGLVNPIITYSFISKNWENMY